MSSGSIPLHVAMVNVDNLFVVRRWFLVLLCACGLVGVAGLFLFPIVKCGDAAFGYDTGIYRRIIIDYAQPTVAPRPPFAFAQLSNALQALGLSVDAVAVGGYVAVHLLIILAVFLVVEEYVSRRAAWVACVLLLTSLVHYEFYWWYYYREAIAVSCILLVVWGSERRSWWIIAPLFIAGSLHPLTLMPWVLTVLYVFATDKRWRRYFFLTHVSAGLAVLLYNWQEFLPYWHIFSKHYGLATTVATYQQDELTGQFIDVATFFKLSLLYVWFGLVGAWVYRKKMPLVFFLLISSVVLFVARVLLYRRFLVLIDIACIVFAAVFLTDLWERLRTVRLRWVFACGYAVVLCLFVSTYAMQKSPLIDPVDIIRIRELDALPLREPVMALSSQAAPWVYGFTRHPVIAPGMFEYNQWNEDEWNVFWQSQLPVERHGLLRRYASPVLLFTLRDDQVFQDSFSLDSGLLEVQPGVWRFEP